MLKTTMIAGAALVALTASSFAAGNSSQPVMQPTQLSWNILKDASSGQCYATDRAAGPSESVLGANFGTEEAAQAMIGQLSACDGVSTTDTPTG